ncbi:glycoside hydrolase family 3 N-terminal domain-containing protein [Cellulomonas cellasea]|uniref:beta-glucosidase n=1 Tax=Cellulomonas cellasea TaxID=43670 RepID=UPI0025A33A31|nr:glycoside hydrolase family 3 N-terminal domain-containing protein [Cellulomonas cellasea]MDM8083616.1 glycoside hydrolase family 3 N-terminal domain-containing protein [Cellulomonas cellasea]
MTTQSLQAGQSSPELAALRVTAHGLPLEQKVRLLTGESAWRLHGDPGLGLRPVAVSDGPVGVRGLGEVEGETSALFPAPSAISATWDRDVAYETGQAFAREARDHGVDVVLAPQVNIQRTPVGGRHFECYSEDPLLTAEIGAQVVRGLQDQGVAACVKHYVANDSETDRTTYISHLDPQTLREVYLAPFERAVAAGAWSVMAAYNQVDDTVEARPMTDHRHLLTELLKGELGFDGVVVSDWVATRTTVAPALGGLDLVMPGPGGPWEGALLDAVRDGRVPEAVIDDKVARLLLLARRVGALDQAARPVTATGDLAALIRRTAAQSTVVLRADAENPVWDRPEPASIALVGPNAVRPHVLGGGSSTVRPRHVVTPAEGLAARYPGAQVTVARGGDPRVLAPRLDVEARGLAGVAVEVTYLAADGSPLRAFALAAWDGWLRDLPDEVGSVALRFDVLLDEPGEHRIEVGTVGAHTATVDGLLVSQSADEVGVEVILDSTINNPEGVPAEVHVVEPRRVEIATTHRVIRAQGYGNLVRAELRHRAPGPTADEEIAAAVEAARAADLTIVVVGTNEEVESEGWDRTGLRLPGRQDELVERVLDVAPAAVVVVNAGAPVVLPWLDRARTVLWAWFPGQEAGHSLADVISGAVEPAGRLPWTLPADEADVPVPHARPVDGVIEYTDGVHVGYRGWERAGRTPAAPFGHGLGWTTWSYDSIGEVATTAEGDLVLTVVITNTGARPGRETVQVYVEGPTLPTGAPVGGHDRPVRWLGGFACVDVAAGDVAHVTVTVLRRQLEVWDTATESWVLPPGEYRLRAGRSVRDLRLDTAVQARADETAEE